MEKTLKNLATAFAGESMARNRYLFYSKIAAKEGYDQISEIFTVTADQEKEHASWLLKLINQLKEKHGGSSFDQVKIEIEVPTIRGTTEENLASAIAGENYEHTSMYPEFADVAEKEGFSDIAARLRSIAVAESHHEERFQKLLDQLKAGTLFKKSEEVWWVCRECGYVHFGKTPPGECPSCSHDQGFYQLKCEEY
jgi:rubrerythrin